MERNGVDEEDVKLVSGLSTILVATIQEARDRISQIEYIFCNQLYSNFQSKSKTLANEKDLLLRISNLEMQLKERGEENFRLLNEVKRLEEKAELAAQGEVFAVDRVRHLEFELGQRGDELHRERVLLADLRREIDSNVEEIVNLGKKLKEAENEKKLLRDKVNGGCNSTNDKCPHEKKLLQRLQADSLLQQEEKRRYSALLKRYKESMSENRYLRGKLGLTEANMNRQDLSGNHGDGMKYQQNSPPSNGVEDKRANVSVTAVVPNHVKIERGSGDELDGGDNVARSIPVDRSGNHRDVMKYQQNLPSLNVLGVEDKTVEASVTAVVPNRVKIERGSGDELEHSPSNFIAPKFCPPTAKSAPVISRKRSASTWIATRSRQLKNGADPHDDFLDTPLENVRKNLNRSVDEEADDLLQAPGEKDVNSHSSDDETQDFAAGPRPQLPQQKQKAVPADGKRDFKYVETIRKKAERDKLKGIECKQCKKFYDSVLQNGGNGNNQPLRCEHHEGISRHRYKFAPPSTPEGFWDIGFESEM